MSRIDDLIRAHCPEGVEYVELGEILDYEQPTRYLVATTDYDDGFDVPVLTAGQTFILGYTSEVDGIYPASPDSPVIIFDDFTTAFRWVDFPFKAKSSAMKMVTLRNGVESSFRFVWYAMQCIGFSPSEHARHWISQYSRFRVPLPPLDVQREIVRVLDLFQSLEAELEAELEARRHQYAHYADSMLTSGLSAGEFGEVEFVSVGDICRINRGRVMSRDYLRDHPGPYPVYSSQTGDEGVFGYIDSFDYDFESITWTTDGANAGSLFFHSGESFSITNVCGLLQVIDTSLVNAKFLYYVLGRHTMRHVSSGMGNPKLMSNVMARIQLPLPRIEEQERLVKILDSFSALSNDLSVGLPAELNARRQQYEYYRNRLLTFEKAA